MSVSFNERPRVGFTLIEALVALTILAIASAGLIRATVTHVDLVRGVQTRAIAQWVAENRLVELTVADAAPTPRLDRVDMLGQAWNVDVQVEDSSDPELAQVTIAVTQAGAGSPAATLVGFIDTGGNAGGVRT